MSVHAPQRHTIRRVTDAPDVLGDHPGEMRPLTDALGAEQIAVTTAACHPEAAARAGTATATGPRRRSSW